ncbi:MAG: hypothetical protein A2277_19910 [Desulfobacterales bacterium RIFOXYA12_FULL_46_15]|nr:MAG: hypothetical protein A2097_14630 [Desulfobacula sp. GWF2_41_7]OGR26981.1 MAG: hypothetical protein A2277_19910 [Desulfobacterales bacterium RIFOXYA12_FULL_46_15]
MSRKIATAFNKFYRNIKISKEYRKIAYQRKNEILPILKDKLNVVEFISTGSVPRNTALYKNADFDLIVVFDYGQKIKNIKPAEVLQSICEIFNDSDIKATTNGQTVTLHYETLPNIDITPALKIFDNEKSIKTCNIPDSTSKKWIQTKPNQHTRDMINEHLICGTSFRKIIMIVKHWNQMRGSYLQSYHIEVMALKIFHFKLENIAWEIFYYFEKAADLISKPLWHEGILVDSYLNPKNRFEIRTMMQNDRDSLFAAWQKIQNIDSGYIEAFTIWKKIFGEKFPDCK